MYIIQISFSIMWSCFAEFCNILLLWRQTVHHRLSIVLIRYICYSDMFSWDQQSLSAAINNETIALWWRVSPLSVLAGIIGRGSFEVSDGISQIQNNKLFWHNVRKFDSLKNGALSKFKMIGINIASIAVWKISKIVWIFSKDDRSLNESKQFTRRTTWRSNDGTPRLTLRAF
jgi:hypothetical protein